VLAVLVIVIVAVVVIGMVVRHGRTVAEALVVSK
jgi:hypothetical protein